MARLIDAFYRLLDLLIIVLLAGMAVMVFLNVILRYGFNSGIPISEELSRFFFVWLTFIGAVAAHRRNMHMGMETVVAALGERGRRVMMGLSDLLILGCCWVLFMGTWNQLPINASMSAPVSGVSMAWVYGIGMFTAVMIALITGTRLLRLIAGRITQQEVDAFAGMGDHFEESAAARSEGASK